jgi:hypothetical protein
MTRLRCFCGETKLTLEEATYVINSVPCHDRDCYLECLEAAGPSIHHIVQVAYRRPAQVAS